MRAVDHFSRLPEAIALAAANKRVFNILAKQSANSIPNVIDPALLMEAAEQHLAAELARLEQLTAPLLAQRDYTNVLQTLALLREPVDLFFDQVMVMADDPALQANRLALLQRLRSLFLNVADISQLVVSQ